MKPTASPADLKSQGPEHHQHRLRARRPHRDRRRRRGAPVAPVRRQQHLPRAHHARHLPLHQRPVSERDDDLKTTDADRCALHHLDGETLAVRQGMPLANAGPRPLPRPGAAPASPGRPTTTLIRCRQRHRSPAACRDSAPRQQPDTPARARPVRAHPSVDWLGRRADLLRTSAAIAVHRWSADGGALSDFGDDAFVQHMREVGRARADLWKWHTLALQVGVVVFVGAALLALLAVRREAAAAPAAARLEPRAPRHAAAGHHRDDGAVAARRGADVPAAVRHPGPALAAGAALDGHGVAARRRRPGAAAARTALESNDRSIFWFEPLVELHHGDQPHECQLRSPRRRRRHHAGQPAGQRPRPTRRAAAIVDGARAAQDDAGVKAIVLTGAGKAFSGGADISEFNTPEGARRADAAHA